jgi:hypothetical protein
MRNRTQLTRVYQDVLQHGALFWRHSPQQLRETCCGQRCKYRTADTLGNRGQYHQDVEWRHLQREGIELACINWMKIKNKTKPRKGTNTQCTIKHTYGGWRVTNGFHLLRQGQLGKRIRVWSGRIHLKKVSENVLHRGGVMRKKRKIWTASDQTKYNHDAADCCQDISEVQNEIGARDARGTEKKKKLSRGLVTLCVALASFRVRHKHHKTRRSMTNTPSTKLHFTFNTPGPSIEEKLRAPNTRRLGHLARNGEVFLAVLGTPEI